MIEASLKQGYLFGIGIGIALNDIDKLEKLAEKKFPSPPSDIKDDEWNKLKTDVDINRSNFVSLGMRELIENPLSLYEK